MFDKNGSKEVPLKDFIDYFTSVTGQIPVQTPNPAGYARKDSNSSDNSLTIPFNGHGQVMANIQNVQVPNYNLNYNPQPQVYQQQYQPQQQVQQVAYLQQQQLQNAQLGAQYAYGTGYGYATDAYGQQYRY